MPSWSQRSKNFTLAHTSCSLCCFLYTLLCDKLNYCHKLPTHDNVDFLWLLQTPCLPPDPTMASLLLVPGVLGLLLGLADASTRCWIRTSNLFFDDQEQYFTCPRGGKLLKEMMNTEMNDQMVGPTDDFMDGQT